MINPDSAGLDVTASKLTKSYTNSIKELSVLEDISLNIHSGEVVAICGRSGIGKSTLLRIIAGLIPATSGILKIGGNDVVEPTLEMGFVTQDYSRSLLPWFSVEKNVALPFRGKNIDKEKRRKAVQEILESVGLTQFAKYYPWQLSGGMQQKVAIARALILSPRLLLLDEPFASVDAQLRLELEDLVATLVSKKKITTIIVTHDMDEAIYMADRVILLSGSPAKIKKIYVVSLKKPRNQIVTRENSTFLKLRNELYEDLKG